MKNIIVVIFSNIELINFIVTYMFRLKNEKESLKEIEMFNARVKAVDLRRGFSNLSQEERIQKLHSIYNEDIFPMSRSIEIDQDHFFECAECISLHSSSRFYCTLYKSVPKEVYFDGVCFCCKKKTKVFNTFLYRQIVLKYGFTVDDWKKSGLPMGFTSK